MRSRIGCAGFDYGADDYLVKPFAMKELVARLKALLPQAGGSLASPRGRPIWRFDTIGREVQVGGVSLARRVTSWQFLE